MRDYLSRSIEFLERIANSEELTQWCYNYDIWGNGSNEALALEIEQFVEDSYQSIKFPSGYYDVVTSLDPDGANIKTCNASWISDLTKAEVYACIAYHFRMDHFCEGSLIEISIATGALLRLLNRLNDLEFPD